MSTICTAEQTATDRRTFATVRNPFTGELVRVELLGFRTCRDVSPLFFIVADVRAPGALLPFSVRAEELRHVARW